MAKLQWESKEEPFVNPIWMFRLFPPVITVLVLLALLVLKPETHANAHAFCLGMAAGLLISFSVVCLQIRSVDMKDNRQPSDVERLPIT